MRHLRRVGPGRRAQIDPVARPPLFIQGDGRGHVAAIGAVNQRKTHRHRVPPRIRVKLDAVDETAHARHLRPPESQATRALRPVSEFETNLARALPVERDLPRARHPDRPRKPRARDGPRVADRPPRPEILEIGHHDPLLRACGNPAQRRRREHGESEQQPVDETYHRVPAPVEGSISATHSAGSATEYTRSSSTVTATPPASFKRPIEKLLNGLSCAFSRKRLTTGLPST